MFLDNFCLFFIPKRGVFLFGRPIEKEKEEKEKE